MLFATRHRARHRGGMQSRRGLGVEPRGGGNRAVGKRAEKQAALIMH